MKPTWVSGNTRLSCSLTVRQHSVEPLSPTLIFPIFTACNVATIQNIMHIGAPLAPIFGGKTGLLGRICRYLRPRWDCLHSSGVLARC